MHFQCGLVSQYHNIIKNKQEWEVLLFFFSRSLYVEYSKYLMGSVQETGMSEWTEKYIFSITYYGWFMCEWEQGSYEVLSIL